MTLYDVHTIGVEPEKHYQQYETAEQAQRMCAHYSEILHLPLTVDAVEVPEPAQAAEVGG